MWTEIGLHDHMISHPRDLCYLEASGPLASFPDSFSCRRGNERGNEARGPWAVVSCV